MILHIVSFRYFSIRFPHFSSVSQMVLIRLSVPKRGVRLFCRKSSTIAPKTTVLQELDERGFVAAITRYV